MNMHSKTAFAIAYVLMLQTAAAQTDKDYKDYSQFDFVPGETILFDDNLVNDKPGAAPIMWNKEGGSAAVINENNESAISINEYYTKLSPKIKNAAALPDSFTIEYDTWLDAGYDGNPGIEIHLMNGDNEIIITPNKHELTVSATGHDAVAKDNPEEYFGENKFYDRWVHISIAYMKKHLLVYLDHYKQIDIADSYIKHLSFSENEAREFIQGVGAEKGLKNIKLGFTFENEVKRHRETLKDCGLSAMFKD